jgi:hypothetical protein
MAVETPRFIAEIPYRGKLNLPADFFTLLSWICAWHDASAPVLRASYLPQEGQPLAVILVLWYIGTT